MRTKLTYAGLALGAVLLAVLCALIPGQANAFTLTPRGGPVEAPGGTYIVQGQIVSLCLSHASNGRSWVEWNTTIPGGLGNCPAGWTQLSVWADPLGVIPAPAPTATASP